MRDVLVRVALECFLAPRGFGRLIQWKFGLSQCEVKDGGGERKDLGTYFQTSVNYAQNHEFAIFSWYLNHYSTISWFQNLNFLLAMQGVLPYALKYFRTCRK